MKIATRTVRNGQIVVEGQPSAEGEHLTVLSYDEREPFRLAPEEKRLLEESIAEADRGELVDGEALLALPGDWRDYFRRRLWRPDEG